MSRAVLPIALTLGVLPLGLPLAAQDWNGASALTLVRHAADARSRTMGPGGLRAYQAEAHGLVQFLQQVGAGFPDRPVRAKVDELRVEVYWQAPGRSKQVIRAWRDTTLLPTNIVYHRDHLGIVINDFGNAIRLGDGDEVRDVPHPLAPGAQALYDFATGNRIELRTPTGVIRVREVMVRPRRPGLSAVVGTLYLDEDSGALVRFRFTFTPAAYRDPTVEDIAVDLENALLDGFWLPWHQRIEIRRQQTLVDFALRGIIRGEWTISGHQADPVLSDTLFRNPLPEVPPVPPVGTWETPLSISLAEFDPAEAEGDFTAARREAARLAGRLLDGLPAMRFAFGGVSDLVRVDRVEGVAIGLGGAFRVGRRGGVRVRPALRLATADATWSGGVDLTWLPGAGGDMTLGLSAAREVRDLADDPLLSSLTRSLLAQEGGVDLADWVRIDRVAITSQWPVTATLTVGASLARERARSLAVRAAPFHGEYRPNPPLGGEERPQAVLRVFGATRDWRIRLEAGRGADGEHWARMHGGVDHSFPLDPDSARLIRIRGEFNQGTTRIPLYRSFALGGWGTLPGTPFRAYGGRGSALLRLDWSVRLPGPALPVGAFGTVGGTMTMHLFGAIGGAWDGDPDLRFLALPWRTSRGAVPVVGLAADLFGGVLHLEGGLGLRGPSGPGFMIDVGRVWWGLM